MDTDITHFSLYVFFTFVQLNISKTTWIADKMEKTLHFLKNYFIVDYLRFWYQHLFRYSLAKMVTVREISPSLPQQDKILYSFAEHFNLG